MSTARSTNRPLFGTPTTTGTVFGRKGASIRYWLYGNAGIPMVLCNGLLSGVSTWEHFVPHFCRIYRVLLWEYPGHGFSVGEGPGNGAGIDLYAEDCSFLLEGVGIDQAVFVGFGAGVQVILEIYRRYPETVKALVGMCGAEQGRLSRFAPFLVGRKVAARSLERLLLPVGTPVWNAFRSLWAASLPFRSAGPWDGTRDGGRAKAWLDRISKTDPEVGVRSLASTLFYHPGSLLPRIRVPVLILGGADDRIVPTKRYAKMGRRIPGARLVLLEGCSHRAVNQAPDKVHTLVEEFLADQGLLPGEDDSE